MSARSVKVLFVCMGNICRSPAGEGIFRHFVDSMDRSENIHIDSAGTIAYHAGEPADRRMREVAARRGYRLESIARVVTVDDLDQFDLIVAMDHDNFAELQRLGRDTNANIRMLGGFIPGVERDALAPAVPDPYYGGGDGFGRVLDMIESACPALLEHCLELLAKRSQ